MSTTGPRHSLQSRDFSVAHKSGVTHVHLGAAERPAALTPDLLSSLREELLVLRNRPEPLVLHGQSGGFCSGMDLGLIADWPPDQSTRGFHASFAALLDSLQQHPATTLAVVEGPALGGGLALAAACDLVVALESARFALPELLWGLLPANALPVVARRMGPAATRRLALLTEPLDAATALDRGLVDFLAPDRPRLEGIVRRLTLRAARLPSASLVQLRQLFEVLDREPNAYPRHALDCITAITDDAEFRRRLADRYRELLGESKDG